MDMPMCSLFSTAHSAHSERENRDFWGIVFNEENNI
jgi:hypothetical protein